MMDKDGKPTSEEEKIAKRFFRPKKKKALSIEGATTFKSEAVCPKCGAAMVERQVEAQRYVFACGYVLADCGCKVAECQN